METETYPKSVEVCNSLLRGEISAVETYGQTISKYDSVEDRSSLEQLRASHLVSVKKLTHSVDQLGGQPARNSGAWGAVANTYQAAANLIGFEAAVDSLITGEQHGRKEYESALANPEVPDGFKELIRAELLPRTTENTITLHELQSIG